VKEERILHIISFNIPYPPDYGGVIDVYYKLKALQECGIRIILHNYQYGREISEMLGKICEEVYYYPREKSFEYFFRKKPFIVVTRNSKELLKRLQKDNYPVLFEGIHSCNFITELDSDRRKLIIRAHNIEHSYYSQLAKNENKIWKKIFFYTESIKLAAFENQIFPSNLIAAISPNDNAYFLERYGNSTWISAFHSYRDVNIQTGFGSHVLYHGNLSVPENIETATFLLQKIFPSLPYPCIIAGKQPDKSLFKIASRLSNVEILANPDQTLMDELIANAQVNLLPAFQESGMKLKLLAALYTGRHCLVNSKMVSNTGLETLCWQADGMEDMIEKTRELILKPFDPEEAEKRNTILNLHFNNHTNAQRLIQMIWPD
jgi:hypothetical protein